MEIELGFHTAGGMALRKAYRWQFYRETYANDDGMG